MLTILKIRFRFALEVKFLIAQRDPRQLGTIIECHTSTSAFDAQRPPPRLRDLHPCDPVIGHLKEHHRMGRNYLAHASGDAINAVLAAAGYNFRRLLAWLRLLLLRILIAFSLTTQLKSV